MLCDDAPPTHLEVCDDETCIKRRWLVLCKKNVFIFLSYSEEYKLRNKIK